MASFTFDFLCLATISNDYLVLNYQSDAGRQQLRKSKTMEIGQWKHNESEIVGYETKTTKQSVFSKHSDKYPLAGLTWASAVELFHLRLNLPPT